jgi:hypothetical protein
VQARLVSLVEAERTNAAQAYMDAGHQALLLRQQMCAQGWRLSRHVAPPHSARLRWTRAAVSLVHHPVGLVGWVRARCA